MQLYDYQIALESGIFDAYRRGRNAVCAVLPTGGGKTVVAASLVSKVAARGKRVYLLAHRREFVGQLSAALERADIRHLAVIRDAMGYRPGWERHRARELGIGRRATA